MSQRFFSQQPIAGAQARLEEDEARHLKSVMRAKPGDEVTLFDGSGFEFLARVVALGKKDLVEFEIVERHEIDREAACQLTLAVALPKGERQRWLVEKATELGVARIVPLATQRGVAEAGEGALERMRRWVIEASKQCGRNRLLEIAAPTRLENLATTYVETSRWIAHPGGAEVGSVVRPASNVLIAIGPEGGFNESELQIAAEAGFQAIGLGARILRVETAAVAIAARWLLA